MQEELDLLSISLYYNEVRVSGDPVEKLIFLLRNLMAALAPAAGNRKCLVGVCGEWLEELTFLMCGLNSLTAISKELLSGVSMEWPRTCCC